jgi:hypothetical protein
MLSVKSGIVPVWTIFGERDAVERWVDGDVFVVSTVAVRDIGEEGVVAHIPKLAMERYMYFAGLVNDNVGVTWC